MTHHTNVVSTYTDICVDEVWIGIRGCRLTEYVKNKINVHYSRDNYSQHNNKCIQIINALNTTAWGKQKVTLTATYKAVMRLTLEYTCSNILIC